MQVLISKHYNIVLTTIIVRCIVHFDVNEHDLSQKCAHDLIGPCPNYSNPNILSFFVFFF